jgi:hypothetical protein
VRRLYAAVFVASLAALAAAVPCVYAQNLARIVEGVEQAQRQNRENCHAYTITREYRFYSGDRSQPTSDVTVELSFVPPNEKTFRIEKSEGSSRGQKIVQHILESEAEAAKKDPPALERRSYDFTLLGEDTVQGHPVWVLGLKPKRSQPQMLEGRAWVDQSNYLIRRVDGDMAKTPSWWLKKIHVTLDYGGANGLWLPLETRAVVDVRLFGTHIVTAEATKILTGAQAAELPADRSSSVSSSSFANAILLPDGK